MRWYMTPPVGLGDDPDTAIVRIRRRSLTARIPASQFGSRRRLAGRSSRRQRSDARQRIRAGGRGRLSSGRTMIGEDDVHPSRGPIGGQLDESTLPPQVVTLDEEAQYIVLRLDLLVGSSEPDADDVLSGHQDSWKTAGNSVSVNLRWPWIAQQFVDERSPGSCHDDGERRVQELLRSRRRRR